MNFLTSLHRAHEYPQLKATDCGQQAHITLVTNFTDDLIKKVCTGLSLMHDIYPIWYVEPYKQYHFSLNNDHSALFKTQADITYLVFDVHPYLHPEVANDPIHIDTLVSGIKRYVAHATGHVVISTFELPMWSVYGNMYMSDPLYTRIYAANQTLAELSAAHSHVTLIDINRMFHHYGEAQSRDVRALAAFDVPFTNVFTFSLCRELMSVLFSLRGKAKKCLVLDMDNTLWGGIVGEVGARGIDLGPGYPGHAYQSFQRALLACFERGIILALCSKNNESDVAEVFNTNPHMILKKEHFGSMYINWQPKSINIAHIARDLNIGLDSLVFLDDDPANREEVRMSLPDVTVPDLPKKPEEYVDFLLSLSHLFHQHTLTKEDSSKGLMYSQERQRKELMDASTPTDYLAKLGIKITLSENNPEHIARAAQLSQKTNQFNLSTKRYTESDITHMLQSGATICTAEVSDSFGHYGVVVLAIIQPTGKTSAHIDTFLMSCRAMGRGVEYAVMHAIIEKCHSLGIRDLTALFVQSAKNAPAREFLSRVGFAHDSGVSPDEAIYRAHITSWLKKVPAAVSDILPHITIVS